MEVVVVGQVQQLRVQAVRVVIPVVAALEAVRVMG
jgi:hypothetical protein